MLINVITFYGVVNITGTTCRNAYYNTIIYRNNRSSRVLRMYSHQF